MTAFLRSSGATGSTDDPRPWFVRDDNRPWLVMLYLAGDNNLQEEMVSALQQVTSTTDLPKPLLIDAHLKGDEIFAQLDPSATGVATYRYHFNKIARGDGTKIDDFRAGAIPETNTGNVEALVSFIEWAIKTAGGDPQGYRHLLVLSGHGSGTTQDFLLRDESPSDSLSIPELAEAMRLATRAIGKTIDILGMDACFMSMFEVAYEIRGHVDVLIGAEGLEPEFGWPYGRILANAIAARLATKRPMPTDALAEMIVSEYVEHYADYQRPAGRSADLAAIDLRAMDRLGDAVNALGLSLIDAEKPKNAFPASDRVTLAHHDAQTYKAHQFVDLHDFCIQTYKRFNGSNNKVANACKGVVTVLDGTDKVFDAVDKGGKLTTHEVDKRCVIRSGCCGSTHQHSYGVSIYLPWAEVSLDYENLSFAGVSGADDPDQTKTGDGWLQFLRQQVDATRREARFEVQADESTLPSDASLGRSLAGIDMRRIERALAPYLDDQTTTQLNQVKEKLAQALAAKVKNKCSRLAARRIPTEDGLAQLLRRANGLDAKNRELLREIYPLQSRWGPRTKFGPITKFADSGEASIKNQPPVMGTAYWPPKPAGRPRSQPIATYTLVARYFEKEAVPT